MNNFQINLNMINRILLIIVPLLVIGNQTHAQIKVPVMDNLLKNSIDDNLQKNLQQGGLLEAIQIVTEETKEKVEAIERLQYDYQEFLRQTTSTANLALSNVENEQEVIRQVVASSRHLNGYSFANHLYKLYHQQTEPLEKSQLLHEQLIPYNDTYIFTQLSSFEGYQKARNLNVAALEEMGQRRKLQLANAYQQLAQSKIGKASELEKLLTTDQAFSMTEAERLETIKRMQEYLQRSQQLKVKADQLIQQSAKSAFSKAQVLNSFKLREERKVISSTPLFLD